MEQEASDDEGMVLEPEIEIQVEEGRAVRLEEEGVDDVAVEEEEGVSPPRATPPRLEDKCVEKRKCKDLGFVLLVGKVFCRCNFSWLLSRSRI